MLSTSADSIGEEMFTITVTNYSTSGTRFSVTLPSDATIKELIQKCAEKFSLLPGTFKLQRGRTAAYQIDGRDVDMLLADAGIRNNCHLSMFKLKKEESPRNERKRRKKVTLAASVRAEMKALELQCQHDQVTPRKLDEDLIGTDLAAQILQLLAHRDLARFGCVCKQFSTCLTLDVENQLWEQLFRRSFVNKLNDRTLAMLAPRFKRRFRLASTHEASQIATLPTSSLDEINARYEFWIGSACGLINGRASLTLAFQLLLVP